jgi:hypothetical protein
VCPGKIIACHSFIIWLAIRRRLYTQDKIVAIDFLKETKCVLCGLGEEHVNHLFVAHSQKVFGTIFGINVIFLGL